MAITFAQAHEIQPIRYGTNAAKSGHMLTRPRGVLHIRVQLINIICAANGIRSDCEHARHAISHKCGTLTTDFQRADRTTSVYCVCARAHQPIAGNKIIILQQ